MQTVGFTHQNAHDLYQSEYKQGHTTESSFVRVHNEFLCGTSYPMAPHGKIADKTRKDFHTFFIDLDLRITTNVNNHTVNL